jgi:CheY-like chemotaxis protein
MKKNKSILLVEDDKLLRDLLIKKLEDYGYNVMAAIDGESSLELIKDSKPSLVLLDIMMPGIDGFEVLEKIKNNKDKKIADTPVVMLTNLGQEENARIAKEKGAIDYVLKADFNTDEILEKVDRHLNEYGE